jgi:hypothetical protein
VLDRRLAVFDLDHRVRTPFATGNQVEKGVFYTLSLTRNEPAYFIFVVLSLICLALRVALHAFPSLSRSAERGFHKCGASLVRGRASFFTAVPSSYFTPLAIPYW